VTNRGPETAAIDLLPTVWFRNRWTWDPKVPRPRLSAGRDGQRAFILLEETDEPPRRLFCQSDAELLFTDNETNVARLFGTPNASPYGKAAFHEALVHGRRDAVNPASEGTKAAARHRLTLTAGARARVRLRLAADPEAAPGDPLGKDFDAVLAARQAQADEFYAAVTPPARSADAASVMRQALAGLLWSKQFYHYDGRRWLEGDPSEPPPPDERWNGRNHEWPHHFAADIICMPDKWEYPWYAAWDLAF